MRRRITQQGEDPHMATGWADSETGLPGWQEYRRTKHQEEVSPKRRSVEVPGAWEGRLGGQTRGLPSVRLCAHQRGRFITGS